MRKVEAALLVSFFVAHAIEAVLRHLPWDALWACHVSCLFLAAGALTSSGVLATIGLCWVVFGTPLWVIDLVSGSALYKTSVLTHLGGLALGVRIVRREGVPAGAWWKALLTMLGLVLLTRVLAPPATNVNLAFSVYPGFEKWFPTYGRYFVFMFVLNGVSFLLTEKVARRAIGQEVT